MKLFKIFIQTFYYAIVFYFPLLAQEEGVPLLLATHTSNKDWVRLTNGQGHKIFKINKILIDDFVKDIFSGELNANVLTSENYESEIQIIGMSDQTLELVSKTVVSLYEILKNNTKEAAIKGKLAELFYKLATENPYSLKQLLYFFCTVLNRYQENIFGEIKFNRCEIVNLINQRLSVINKKSCIRITTEICIKILAGLFAISVSVIFLGSDSLTTGIIGLIIFACGIGCFIHSLWNLPRKIYENFKEFNLDLKEFLKNEFLVLDDPSFYKDESIKIILKKAFGNKYFSRFVNSLDYFLTLQKKHKSIETV